MNNEQFFKECVMAKYLVTGGAGFLGSNLCERLLEDGHAVICLDNFLTGRKSNVEHLLANSAFQLVEHDVVEPYDFNVDGIYNLACPASPPHYQADPVYTTKISVLGALNALDLAKRLQVPVFQASTSEVYGDPEVHPQQEDYTGAVNPIGIRSCYDEGKRCAESLFFDYHRQYGVGIKVVRIFNTYGPKMDPKDGRVVSNFIIQALRGEDLTIYGDGSQTRSFCYVDDLIDGFVSLMDSPAEITGPINIGNPVEFTVGELAEKVTELVGGDGKVLYMDLPQDDPTRRKPDISKAKRELDWSPKVALNEGLLKTIEYFREEMSLK